MCNVCGCGKGEVRINGKTAEHAEGHDHDHAHNDGHHHTHQHADGHHHWGTGAAHAHASGLSQGRMVQIEQDILAKNNQYAAANRHHFEKRGIFALNLVSSPGSGKTSLLVRAIQDLQAQYKIAVIEGDQQTSNDAERIRATGVSSVQINTGKGCHLDAHMIGHALDDLSVPDGGLLFIENVGNLVCPAGFDLGEAHKVVILSITEGEDKPIKYPDMFAAADLMLLNKVDLAPHLSFDMDQCGDYARRVNSRLKILPVSATSGEGLEAFYRWIEAARNLAMIDSPAGVSA